MVAMANPKRVCLRLDDGTIVGPADVLGVSDADPGSAVALDVDAAFAADKLPRNSIGKLESLLREFVRRLPADRQRQLRTVDLSGLGSQAGLQRQQSDLGATPRANGRSFLDDEDEDDGTPGAPAWQKGEFERQCLDILEEIWKMYKPHEIIYFNHPVEEHIVKDYFNVVRRQDARDLGTMKKDMQRKRYNSPQDFYDDFQLFSNNCIMYNGADKPFGLLGAKVLRRFEELWAASGLGGSGQRAKRAKAGVAAPRYEPQYSPPPPEKRPPARTSSVRSGSRPARAPKRTQSQTSGGATAKKALSRGEMPRSRMQQIATALGSMEGEDLNGVLTIIRDSTNLPENGEIELDFDALDHGTLWKLDDYLQKINKGTGAGGTFQVVDDSDSDGEESESDSAD